MRYNKIQPSFAFKPRAAIPPKNLLQRAGSAVQRSLTDYAGKQVRNIPWGQLGSSFVDYIAPDPNRHQKSYASNLLRGIARGRSLTKPGTYVAPAIQAALENYMKPKNPFSYVGDAINYGRDAIVDTASNLLNTENAE